MKTQPTILTILLATLLSGCGVKEEDHQRVLTELEETKQALEQSQSEVSSLKDKLTSAEKEVESLKNSDQTAFANASSVSDRERRKAALLQFVQSYPQSSLTSDAKTIVESIDEEMRQEAQLRQAEAERQRLAAAAERREKEAQQAELRRKIQSGRLTSPEWSSILVGLSEQEVLSLLGRPDRVNENAGPLWEYRGRAIDRITGEVKQLQLRFNGMGGKVKSARAF